MKNGEKSQKTMKGVRVPDEYLCAAKKKLFSKELSRERTHIVVKSTSDRESEYHDADVVQMHAPVDEDDFWDKVAKLQAVFMVAGDEEEHSEDVSQSNIDDEIGRGGEHRGGCSVPSSPISAKLPASPQTAMIPRTRSAIDSESALRRDIQRQH